jgi:hypothetical protein|tara:strand:- start:165 stop:293 length:129 start_codon:yes stop_codon:yes gene_type:complete
MNVPLQKHERKKEGWHKSVKEEINYLTRDLSEDETQERWVRT